MSAPWCCKKCWPKVCACDCPASRVYLAVCADGYWFEGTVARNDSGRSIFIDGDGTFAQMVADKRRADQAFSIADDHCWSLIISECVSVDLDAGVWAFTNKGAQLSEAIQEAIEWLVYRGFAEVSTDAGGQTVTLREPE